MDSAEFLIAQITDPHIGTTLATGANDNITRLDLVLCHLSTMRRRPDLLVVTGDLADRAEAECYGVLRERLERCGMPFHVCLGNRDNRALARAAFAPALVGFFHYVTAAGPLRLIMLDTLEEGRHGGAFCSAREEWLRARLAEEPDRPTLIALHHPPIDSGIDWVTTDPAEPWVGRLDSALAGREHVVALLAGHFHRAIAAGRKGLPVVVCPSVAAPITLDLARLDPAAPDLREFVTDGPPGYALHLWRAGSLTSHFGFVEDNPALARFDDRLQPVVAARFAERP
jgi:3',5'-cyclic AMP phosphodiesterase CpdA